MISISTNLANCLELKSCNNKILFQSLWPLLRPMAGWCNGSTSRSEREAVGSNPNPATTVVTDLRQEKCFCAMIGGVRSEEKAAVLN